MTQERTNNRRTETGSLSLRRALMAATWASASATIVTDPTIRPAVSESDRLHTEVSARVAASAASAAAETASACERF